MSIPEYTKKPKRLTLEQKAVVTFTGGHSIVTAVAGSGKTTTLIKRIEFLIKNVHVNPKDILILMYNKEAQVSFDNKLSKINGLSVNRPEVRTFHSYARKLLVCNDQNFGRGQHHLLAPKETKTLLIQSFIESSGKMFFKTEEIEELELFINICKANNISPESCESEKYKNIYNNTEVNRLAFSIFNRLLMENHARTFDDLLLNAMNDLIQYPQCIEKPKYIVVDEYQDVNLVQHTLVRLLTDQNKTKVMIVGDSNQTIYKFRGSNVKFIEHIFSRDFPGVTHLRLSTSFRFGHAISMIANRVMLKNKKANPDQLCISSADNFSTTVKLSSATILEELGSFTRLIGSKAILARNRSDLVESLIYLKINGIAYNTNKVLSQSKQDEMAFLTMLTFLALTSNDKRYFSSQLIINALPGFLNCSSLKISKQQQVKLVKLLKESTQDFYVFMLNLLIYQSTSLNKEIISFISKQKLSKTCNLCDLIDKLELIGATDVAINSSCNRKQSNNFIRTLNNIKEVTRLSVLQAQDIFNIFKHDNTKNGILLSTIHGTKGLEWEHVMLVGLNDDSFPSSKESDELQEERRLFYVAITRCMKSLTLLVPEDTMLNNWLEKGWYSTPISTPTATRFIYESDIQNAMSFSKVCKKGSFIPKEFYKNRQYREYHQQLSQSEEVK